MAKRIICIIIVLCLCFSMCSCGGKKTYAVRAVETLVEQEYALAFRNEDPIYFYVTAAIQVLMAEGKVAELSSKWLGGEQLDFPSDISALDIYAVPQGKTFIIGVDVNSFPFVYMSNDTVWGFDIELAQAVTDKLGWTLKAQSIEKENVYAELYSGNIDCAWGGVAIDPKDVDNGRFIEFGPYIKNDIVIAVRDTGLIRSASQLKNKTLGMPSTTEAKDALYTDERLAKRLGNIIRLIGGTNECFNSLYAGECDAVLTDSTAIMYYNCH